MTARHLPGDGSMVYFEMPVPVVQASPNANVFVVKPKS